MGNHIHLLVTPAQRGSVGAMLQELGRRYVRIINALHGRTGTLWEGRFKSSLIDSEAYLLTCHRYIEFNPVRAGLVAHPAAYRWSSHEHYAAGKLDGLITEHERFSGLGRDREERQAAFRELFENDIDPETLARIRDSVNAGCALGPPAFLEAVKARVGRPVGVPKRGRPTKPLPEDDGAVMPVSGKLF
jgi:putative transposase